MDEQELSARLRRAFPPTVIDGRDAFATWGRTYSDGDEYARHLEGKVWDALDRAYLDLRSDALGFLGTNHLAAVLPAYLRQLIEGDGVSQVPDILLLVLAKPGPKQGSPLGAKRFDAMVDALTMSQREVVAATLEQFAAMHPEDGQGFAAQLALDVFWDRFIKESE
jgi:hypothetical protein